MSEHNPLETLFKSKTTKAEFISKYKEIRETQKNEGEDFSIFDEDLEFAVSELFDTLNTNSSDDILDDNELQTLRELSDDNDNNSQVTKKDVNVLYENTIKRLGEKYKNKTTDEIYNDALNKVNQDNNDLGINSPQQIISEKIQSLEDLLTGKENSTESKIKRYEDELENLILIHSNLSEKDKIKFSKNRADINNKKSDLVKKEQQLKIKQYELDLAKAEIEYNKKHKDLEKPEIQNHITEFTGIYNSLYSEIKGLNSEITSLTNEIKILNTKQTTLCEKAKMNNNSFEEKKKELQNKIETEKKEILSYRESCQTQIATLEKAHQYATQHDAETYPKEYYDKDISNFSYDAQELQSKWKAKWTKDLGGESKAQAKIDKLGGSAFFNKVCAIANRLNCDSNALMGVMNAESGVRANIGNMAGGSAVGLIQFMPTTAKSLGTTREALLTMDAVEQLNYVEKYLQKTKKEAGISADTKLDSGTLYTLVFLPGYAKRDVLTVKGHKFYKANSGLDRDGDNMITKADMARRVREKMA